MRSPRRRGDGAGYDRAVATVEEIRARIEGADRDPAAFRAALAAVPREERDAWVDRVLGLGAIDDDAPELPRDCVPYLPSSIDALARVVEHARVGEGDVFVDVGAGPGRACSLVHLLSGARCVGLEVQPALVRAGRALASRMGLSRVSFIETDASRDAAALREGTVFFLYCPFSGARLRAVLGAIELVARTRPVRVACLDMPPLDLSWLSREEPGWADLDLYRSRP